MGTGVEDVSITQLSNRELVLLLTLNDRTCRALGRGGAIRLQEDGWTAGRHGLSVRDADLEIAALADEKGGDGDDEDEEGCGAEPWAL